MGIVSDDAAEQASPQRDQTRAAGSGAFRSPLALPDLPVMTANKDSRSSNFQSFAGRDVIIQRTNQGGEEQVHVLHGNETHIYTSEGACLEAGVHFVNAWLVQT